MELNFDPAKFVRINLLAFLAHNHCRLRALDHRFGRDARGAERLCGSHGGERAGKELLALASIARFVGADVGW